MVREPDATRQPTPHDNQLMSKHRVLSLKPQLRLEWRGQNETKHPDHSASLGDSITSSTGIRFSVHTISPRSTCRCYFGKVPNNAFKVKGPLRTCRSFRNSGTRTNGSSMSMACCKIVMVR